MARVRSDVAHGGLSGLVPASRVGWIFDEIERRAGQAAGARGIGFSDRALWQILHRRGRYVQLRHVEGAIRFLRELRAAADYSALPKRRGRPARFYSAQGRLARSHGCGAEKERVQHEGAVMDAPPRFIAESAAA